MAVDHSFLYGKLENIVGSENITDKEIVMEAYTAGGYHTGQPKDVWYQPGAVEIEKPSFIVRPGSKEEIQEIVRLANQYKVPIVPMGSLTGVYRGAVPLAGGIMLDLSRMKKIEVDEELMTVTFEPGVTWGQAWRELALKGYYISSQALPGSTTVLGVTTQAGTHLPYDKHAMPFGFYYAALSIGLEVVLPTGELLVTGSAALPGMRPQRPRAYGPDVGAIFLGAAGTLGIIVKQTLPLYPLSEARHVVTGWFKDENFEGLSRAMKRVTDDNMIGPWWSEMIWALYKGNVMGKPWKRPGEWEFYVQLYGRKETVEFYREFTEKIIKEEGGEIAPTTRLEWPHTGEWRIPETTYTTQVYECKTYWRPRASSVILLAPWMEQCSVGATVPYHLMPELHAAAMKVFANHGVPKSRLGKGFLTLASAKEQSFRITYTYDLNDAEEVKTAKTIEEEWARVLPEIYETKQLPFRYYRPTPRVAKTLMPKLGEYYNLLVKLKRMLDPNRTMNPGKLMDIEPY